MKESIERIISEFNTLHEQEKNLLLNGLTKHFGKCMELSSTGLSKCNQMEIDTIRKMLSGLCLTKEYVPDILTFKEWSKAENLPKEIKLGHPDHTVR